MLTDLAPMDACPFSKNGRHDLSAILPDSSEGDVTLFCDGCGAMRRVPVTGAVVMDNTADMTVEEIERRLFGRA
jgi:hypothetical protein